jgi:hypothetical protein
LKGAYRNGDKASNRGATNTNKQQQNKEKWTSKAKEEGGQWKLAQEEIEVNVGNISAAAT